MGLDVGQVPPVYPPLLNPVELRGSGALSALPYAKISALESTSIEIYAFHELNI